MWKYMYIILLSFSTYSIGLIFAIRQYTKEDVIKLREEVRDMFQHAYDGYLKYAYPYDELRPLSCDGVDTWGSYSLTLVDALDTLVIMGNYTEFERVVNIVTTRENFDSNINVSVFETNIRLVGGLLSAHLLSHRAGLKLEPGWPCNGPLLRLAEDVAQRLIAAFDTPTGMPYGTVNLRHGVPRGETSVTCTAGIGTFIVEFGTLSRLTGDPIYEEVAMHAIYALYNHKSPIGLLGNHIDVMNGRWVAQDSGIGAGVDSYFEYLVKGAILFQKPELMEMFNEGRAVVDKYLKKDDWYVWVSMSKGQVTLPVFQSLEAYWPGVLSLIGDTDKAMRILHNYHGVWRQYGFTPEVYNIGSAAASGGRESYPLRPELVESLMYLYRDTRDPIILRMGEDILRSLQHSAKTKCGYATIKDVRDHRKEDRMESFFLSETTKYLYLLFDPDNFIHNTGHKGTIVETPHGECIMDVGGYIFNTEAHPIDPTALHCCHTANKGLDLDKIQVLYKSIKMEKDLSTKKTNKESHKIPAESLELNVSTDFSQALQNLIKIKTKRIQSKLQTAKKSTKNDSLAKNVTLVLNVEKEDESDKKHKPLISLRDKDDVMLNNSIHNPDLDFLYLNEETESFDDSEPLPPPTNIQKPKSSSSVSFLSNLINEFITSSLPAKGKCEPQALLERIRKEKLYEIHPSTEEYSLLQTTAQSFLRRFSLAGEFIISYLKD